MAKRTAHLHIGLPHSGGERIDAALQEHADLLAGVGVLVPSTSVEEMFRAAVELRREHKAWGLRRKDVEGVWNGVCRRTTRGHEDVLVGHHLLAGCTEAEIDLLVDRLAGFAVHVVVTVAAPNARLWASPDDHDLADVLRRWDRAVASPEHLHVVVCDPIDPTAAWEAIGALVGFEAADLTLPSPQGTAVDTRALRLIAQGTAALASATDLATVVEEWAKVVAGRGYDVHGDLGGLLTPVRDAADDDSGELAITALSDALADALAEVSRLRARALELTRANAKLTAKRGRLKARLRELR